MRILLATVVLAALVLVGGISAGTGCVSANSSTPLERARTSGRAAPSVVGTFNVYQPRTLATAKCSEIELRWRNKGGIKSAFFPGQGGFCAYLPKSPNSPVQARCVARDSSGQVIEAGKWTKAREADSIQQFLGLCPEPS